MPNVITYHALISASEKGLQPERALEVFYAMQQQGVMPDVITYNALSVPLKRASSQSEPWSSSRQCSSTVL